MRMKLLSFLRFLAVRAAMSFAIYLCIAGGLIASQWPGALPETESLDFYALTEDRAGPQHAVGVGDFQARDGATLPVRRFEAQGDGEGAALAIVVHGSGWHGGGYLELAGALSEAGLDVLVPDLRGHGDAPERRGDIDYIGQLEDDLADLILAERQPGQPVALVGHSSGGGLAIRFAGGAHRDLIDRAVLIAPFLKYDAPTMRENSGDWAWPLTRRIIGLSMLNRIGFTALNGLTIMQFNFPRAVLDGPQGHTATAGYSFRLNTSYAPRDDYLEDVAALPPFLLLAGADDQAFRPEAYEPTLSAVTNSGRYEILPGVGHLGVIRDSRAFDAIARFLTEPR